VDEHGADPAEGNRAPEAQGSGHGDGRNPDRGASDVDRRRAGDRGADDPGGLGTPGEDLPTIPPPPRASVAGLRWATEDPVFLRHRPARPTEAGIRRRVVGPGDVPPPHWPVGRPSADDPAPHGPGPAVPADLPTPARGGRRVRVLVLTTVLLAAAAAVGAGTWWAVRPGGGSGAEVRDLGGLLDHSAQARQQVLVAITAACRPTGADSTARSALMSELRSAVAERQSVLAQLGRLRGGDISSLAPDLSRATTDSIAADQDYLTWLDDLQSTGCYSNPDNDLAYQEALSEDATASREKALFLQGWNPLAARHGQRTWQPWQI
jgi:hypothetical protein